MSLKSKLFLLFGIILIAIAIYWKRSSIVYPPLNQSRLLLTKIREGDYAHAGDREAIDLILARVTYYLQQKKSAQVPESSPEDLYKNTKTLDVGCGFGGTADYLYSKGFHNIRGFDIDKASIDYASLKYPRVNFSVDDVRNITHRFEKNSFSLIYLFNTFYALSDQPQALNDLAEIAEPGAILVIFDYSYLQQNKSHGLKDLLGNKMRPIVIGPLRKWLDQAGWEILEETDLSQHFIRWYWDLLKKLELRETIFLKEFSEDLINKFYKVYADILKELNEQVLGGIVVYAKRKPSI
jgi:SAM-dependent methyltransferase